MRKCFYTLFSLGQAGFRFEFEKTIVFIDPYLSNSVQQKESIDLARLLPVMINPEDVVDADWIVITHGHRDHCDLDTLLPIVVASPACRLIGPLDVVIELERAGIDAKRLVIAACDVTYTLGINLTVQPVPAAHPTLQYEKNGIYSCLGYVMKFADKTFYYAGDTSPDKIIIDLVNENGKIDIAFLPVNEKNYFLGTRGIIGNMSVREAFQFTEEIEAKVLVPTHWDMFEVNSVFKEEIEFLYKKLSPNFKLDFYPYYVG